MKLQGLPSGEVIASLPQCGEGARIRCAGTPLLAVVLRGFNSPGISENCLLLADHLRMQMVNFGGSKYRNLITGT